MTGFEIKVIPYKRQKREIGKSRWTSSKKIKYLINGVLAYSYFPLRFMTSTGIVLFLIWDSACFLYSDYLFYWNIPFKGWAPILILILVLSGIQMLMLGIIGEYLWRTLDQVRSRSIYLIEKIDS